MMQTTTSAIGGKLAARGLRPAAELAKDRPHGDRLRYIAGCRCFHCRRANSDYERARQAARKAGDWNGLVAAAKARGHLAALSALGVGRHAVADASGISGGILWSIIKGDKQNIRARTERAILSVTVEQAADRALIDAGETWKLIDELLVDGYSKAELARLLGYRTRALQLNRHKVTARNAYEVKRLHEKLRKVDAKHTARLLDEIAAEGYTRRMIFHDLDKLAAEQGIERPSIEIRKGRILASAARLVERLHALWIG